MSAKRFCTIQFSSWFCGPLKLNNKNAYDESLSRLNFPDLWYYKFLAHNTWLSYVRVMCSTLINEVPWCISNKQLCGACVCKSSYARHTMIAIGGSAALLHVNDRCIISTQTISTYKCRFHIVHWFLPVNLAMVLIVKHRQNC